MYEKIIVIILTLFAIASSGEISSTKTEVKDADFSDSRLSPILLLPSPYNDQHFTKTKANRRSVFLLTPLSQTRSKQRQPREAAQKTKSCGAHLRKSRLFSPLAKKNFAKTRDPNVNVHLETSRNIPHVSARNIKYPSENSTAPSWTKMKMRDENKTLLRALQDSLKDVQDSIVDVDSQEETKRCNKFVCYCQENCLRKSKTGPSRMLGSSRRMKPGKVNYQRPILNANVLRPGSPRWYHEARHDPHVLELINSAPMRPHQKITNPAFFAPLLHGVPLVPSQMIGKDGKFINAAFPYTSFEDRPNFTVGDNIHYQRPPISSPGTQKCHYSSQENQLDVSTVSATPAWNNTGAMINLNEENTTNLSTSHETANYLGEFINPVTESNVELENIIETTEINAAETLPRLSATFSTDHVASVTETEPKDNFESYFSSGTVRTDSVDEEFPRATTPEISYVNVRTDSEARNNFSLYYSETTTTSATTDQSESSADPFRETILSWTNKPDLKTGNSFDQRMNDFQLTTTESYEYTRPAVNEFDEYVETTERTYDPNEDYDVRYSNENKLFNINKHVPMKKLTDQTIGEIEGNTRDKLLGKSKSHTTKMLLSPSYDRESTTENSPASEEFLYSTISYESNAGANDLATINAIRENLWTSAPPFSQRVYEEKTTTPYYKSTTDHNFKKGTANILMESITETYPWRTTLQDQLTTAQYSNREKTNNDDKGDLEYITESLVGITESSAKGLSFCDNSLLLSSIKRVINNFASSGDLTKAQNLDEETLRMQGKSLLPEILQIPNLKDILSTPRIEDTIVAKVKDVLSNVKSNLFKDKLNFAEGWSHGVIRNTLRKLSNSFRGLQHERKLPSMTVEEHQFNHGQWRTKLVTLPPVHGKNSGKLSMAPGRPSLRESIKDFLGIPAIASQADRQVVRNMIVQSLKNDLGNKREGEGPEMEDSVILNALNDTLQALRGLKDMNVKNVSKGDDVNPKVESVNEEDDEEDTNIPQETSTRYEDDFKTKANAEESVANNVKQFQKDMPVDGIGSRTTSYQKVEKLDSNLRVSTACEPANLMKGKLYEEEAVSLTTNLPPGATTISSTNIEAFHEGTENVLNSMSTMEDVEIQQNNEEAQNDKSWKYTTHQQLSKIYQQPDEINQQRSKIYIPQKAAGHTTKDAYTTGEIARDNVLDETEYVGEQYNEPWKTTVSTNNIQMTIASTCSNPRMNGSPETPNEESNAGIETITVQNEATPSISRFSETNTQENTRESSNCTFLREPSETLSSKPEILTLVKITKWYDKVTTGFDETTTEIAKQDSFTSKSFIADEAYDKTLATAILASNSMSTSTDCEPQISTTDFYIESYLDRESDDEMTQRNAINPTEKYFPKHDEMDPTMMRMTNDIDAPPINYYSPNDRILNYVKSHHADKEDETATATVSSMRKSSSDYAQLSDEAILNKNTAAATNAKHEMKYTLNDNVFSPSENTAGDSISSAKSNDYGNRKTEAIVSSSSANADSLSSQQSGFQTGNVIKIHEVTTEVQKTYAKTVYFQPRQFDPADDSRTNSPTIAYEDTSVASSNDNCDRNSNNDDSNDPSDKNIDNVGDVAAEANKNIVSATELSLEDVSDTLQVIPSPTVSEENIEQLQKSQLYYISDGVKLPLEIRRLKDGTYALSISKDICEQIMRRKCCVPLQGHVVQSPKPDTRMDDAEEDYQSVTQALSSTTTLRNTLRKLEKEAEEELNVYRLSNYRRKRDLIESDTIVSMPVLDFARKYNLSLDFDEKEMALNELRSSGKIRNFGDSLKQLAEKSEYNQLNEKNLNGYSEVKRSGLQGEKDDKVRLQDSMNTHKDDILGENIKDLKKKSYANADQLAKVKTSRLRKLENKDDDQRSANVKQIMDFNNQASNSISKGTDKRTDIFKEEAKFNEMKWGDFEILVKKKGEIPEEIKLIKLKKDKEKQLMDNNAQNELNVSKIKVSKNMKGRPYRYQRNTSSGPNKGTEIVKKFLYWLKSLFLNTNKS